MQERTLAQLQPGERTRIVRFAGLDAHYERNLLALGIFPGVAVEVLQISPVIVIRFAHAQLALDRRLAASIYVVERKK